MAISRIGWYAIWLISLLSYAGNHRVSPLGVSPFAWMQSPADPEAKPIFPNLGLKSGAWKFEKKVSMPFWSEYEGELPCDDGSYKLVKRLGFFNFSGYNSSFY